MMRNAQSEVGTLSEELTGEGFEPRGASGHVCGPRSSGLR